MPETNESTNSPALVIPAKDLVEYLTKVQSYLTALTTDLNQVIQEINSKQGDQNNV